MLDERFIFLGTALSFYGGLSYLLAVVRGQAQPNRMTWFLWALAPLIAFVAELEKGVGLPALMTFMVGFNPLLIIIASFFNKKAYWKLQRSDYFYGSLSLLGIILWQATGEGNVAILFAVLADGLASIPTVIKAYHQPETENDRVYLFGMINALITLLTLTTFDIAHLAFPVYIFCICALIFSLVRFKWGQALMGHDRN